MRLCFTDIKRLLEVMKKLFGINDFELFLFINCGGRKFEDLVSEGTRENKFLEIVVAANREGWMDVLISAIDAKYSADNIAVAQFVESVVGNQEIQENLQSRIILGATHPNDVMPDEHLQDMIDRGKQVSQFADQLIELTDLSDIKPLSFACSSVSKDKPGSMLDRIQVIEFKDNWPEMPDGCIKADEISINWPTDTPQLVRYTNELKKKFSIQGCSEEQLTQHLSQYPKPLLVKNWINAESWSELAEELAASVNQFWCKIKNLSQPICIFYVVQVDREAEKQTNPAEIFLTQLKIPSNLESTTNIMKMPTLGLITRSHAKDWANVPVRDYCNRVGHGVDIDDLIVKLDSLFIDADEEKYLHEVNQEFWGQLCQSW